MTNFKGTKEEWKISNKINVNENGVKFITIDFETSKDCMDIYFDNRLNEKERYKEAKANAKLIACAPEMLEMLGKVLKIYGRGYEPKENVDDTIGSNLYKDIKQLIKKAT